MTSRRVGKTLHFEQSNLIQTARKDIDNVSILRGTLGEVIIELHQSIGQFDTAFGVLSIP